MEKDRTERYAESLQRMIRNDYQYLKETIPDFQELCRLVTPEKNVPSKLVSDIREMYKELRNRLAEINGVKQLLQGKYHAYYRRDPLLDKEVMEFGFILKNTYTRFESVMLQKQKQEWRKSKEKEQEQAQTGKDQGGPGKWFRSSENQMGLWKALRLLKELDYEARSEEMGPERRLTGESGPRSLTLFVLAGEVESLDRFQTTVRFREHDLLERYGPHELRGLLVHLRAISPSQLQKVFERLLEERGKALLKCLLLPIQSEKEMDQDLNGLVLATLPKIGEGEVRIVSVSSWGKVGSFGPDSA